MRIRLIGTGRTTKTAPIERQGGRSRGTPLPSKEFCDTLYIDSTTLPLGEGREGGEDDGTVTDETGVGQARFYVYAVDRSPRAGLARFCP
jgi:hypothetical protein